MKNSKLKTFGFWFLVFGFITLAAGCAQQEQAATTTTTTAVSTTTTATSTTTTTTTTTLPPTPGYKAYNCTDASGQKFSFEYPEGWTVSEESLTSSWESGKWVSLEGPGSWESGVPILDLWIVPKSGALTNATSYNTAAYSDRNVAAAEESSPGMLSETATTETVAGITAEGWIITFRTTLPIGYTYTEGTVEVDVHVAGNSVTAERKWAVFQKGNYLYDLNFVAIGDKVASCEAAYLHAINTFQFK